MKVKIIGAGSAGTHLAFACRSRKWQVTLVDRDSAAIDRVKNELFPKRYGFWDSEVKLETNSGYFPSDVDVVMIATPPESHLEVAIRELKAKSPRLLLIEKPIFRVDDPLLGEFQALVQKLGIPVISGFNLNLTPNTKKVEELLELGVIGPVHRIDVEFREKIDYILKAHWWLKDVSQSYLSSSKRGGGSLLEHSHAVALWTHFANRVRKSGQLSVKADFIPAKTGQYDSMASVLLKSEDGLAGSIHTDFVTSPAIKRASIIGEKGRITWWANYASQLDRVEIHQDQATQIFDFPKTRSEDFIPQIVYLEKILSGETHSMTNSIDFGFEVMNIIKSAYQSDPTFGSTW